MKLYLYPLFFVVALGALAVIAVFVPPIYANCDCPFNTIKGALIFPGSAIASTLVVYFTHTKVWAGSPQTKSFLKNLLYISIIYAILGIANLLIFG